MWIITTSWFAHFYEHGHCQLLPLWLAVLLMHIESRILEMISFKLVLRKLKTHASYFQYTHFTKTCTIRKEKKSTLLDLSWFSNPMLSKGHVQHSTWTIESCKKKLHSIYVQNTKGMLVPKMIPLLTPDLLWRRDLFVQESKVPPILWHILWSSDLGCDHWFSFSATKGQFPRLDPILKLF